MRKAYVAVVVAIAVAAFSSCVTPAARQLETAVRVNHEALRLEADYLDHRTLGVRYGDRQNPFVAAPMLITPVEFLVFDAVITGIPDGYEVELDDIELEFGGQTHSLSTPSRMRTYWDSTSAGSEMNAIEERRFYALIDSEMINRTSEPATGSAEGLLVFRARSFPLYGEGRLTIPVYNVSTGRVERVSAPLQFIEDRTAR